MIPRSTLRSLVALAAVALLSVPAVSFGAPPTYVSGQIIIKYKNGTQASERATLRNTLGGPRLKDLPIINGELVRLKTNLTVEQALSVAKSNPNVVYAEPDFVWKADEIKHSPRIDLTPNDPMFNQLYGMTKISAPNAWDVFTGNPDLLIGVIDTGIDYTHPDLAANAWTNPGEIPGNSIDDDGNGFIDDVHGYDFVNNDGNPMDDHFHGTHCSGTIGGVGNNGLGVVGVNWNVKIAGIKFLDSGGSGSTANAILSVQYAVTIGCRLTSNSWGGGAFSQSLKDAIDAAGTAGQLFVAAAGNAGSNNDTSPSYPASYTSPNIIAVAATDSNDQIASFSNFGLTSVDLGAPGVDILSCQPGGLYQLLSGTSMATPHVAGACAMVWGRFPGMTYQQVKDRIMNFADPIPALTGRCITGARLNVFMAIADPDSIAPGAITDLAATNPGSTTMDLTWTATGDDGGAGRASRTELRYSTAAIDDGNFSAATLVPTGNPDPAGTAQAAPASGLAYSTTYFFAIKAFDEFGNAGPLSNLPTGTTLDAPALTTSAITLVTLDPNQTADRTLTVTNSGLGTLDWSIPPAAIQSALTPIQRKSQPVVPPLVLAKNQPDPRHGEPVIEASGGPDAFGYRWIDSDSPGGPAFAWVDISGVGTPIAFTGDDQNLGPFPIGFNFPFYGGSFGSVRVCTNGWLSFTSTLTTFTNQTLPTPTPQNLVAPMWDDLNFTSGGQAYYYNDGSRFIVAWVSAPHYTGDGSAPGPYTFEAILYPSGEIRYQYLVINAPNNSATVGIQDAAGTTGLQTAFNTVYTHANLAVRYATIPQWLTLSPTSGRLTAGQSADVNLHYDSAGLTGGMHDALVSVLTNAPTNASLPAQLLVNGVPDITASPPGTDFGLVFVGQSRNRTVAVSNNGTGQLNVTSVTTGDASVTAGPASFSLAPGGSQNVTVTYAPTAPSTLVTSLTIASDDPDESPTVLALTGSANDAPDIAESNTSLGAWMQTNSSETQVLRVSNTASVSAADLSISVGASISKAGLIGRPEQGYLELGKDQADPRQGQPRTEASGGPDAFGYKFKDSDEAGGPVFNWVDISGIGTPIALNGDDQTVTGIPIGFSFPFYGTSFTTLNACSNGWLSFTSTATVFANAALPTGGTTAPENLVAPFWDDLDFRPASGSSRAYYYYDGARLIVEYKDVPHYATSGPGGPYTFEVLLYPSGKIEYQYLNIPLLLNSCTIGIQNAARAIGLQMVFNANYVHNNLAVRIQKTPEWLRVTPIGSTIAGQTYTDLDVTYNSTDLTPGTYLGNIHIASNDPDEASVNIPVTLRVISPTDVESSAPVAYGLALASGNPSHGKPRFMMAIPRQSDVNVRVYNVKGTVVRSLVSRAVEPGYHPLGWDGRTADGQRVASGVYFVRMHAGTFDRTVRVTLMR